MNPQTFVTLEYDKIKAQLKQYTLSFLGARHVDALQPSVDKRQIDRWIAESAEAKALVSSSGSVPIPALDGIERVTQFLGKSFVFTETDFAAVATFLRSTSQLQQYFRRKQEIAPMVSAYVEALYPLDHLREEIDRCIVHDEVADTASVPLHRARKQEAIVEARLRKKFDGWLQKYRSFLQESMVLQRGGRFVLAIRKDQKRMVPGSVIDESASGHTVFIEPAEAGPLHAELEALRAEVEQEKYRVLCTLSAMLDDGQVAIRANLETVGICDFVVAKGKYARALAAEPVEFNERGIVAIRQGRHPLLGQSAVPIDFQIGTGYRALLITGPNTGGKTVSLKTVGLLTLMAQSGLLIPVARGSMLAIFHQVLPDIGDGQSLEQTLSTFSAHVRNLVEILRQANTRTLVLLDELASGTDPGEGIGLSIAVLERLYRLGSTIVATTHFSEIKDFACSTAGFEVARMEFDVDSLQPLYRLRIGEAGESYALLIAQKLGMDIALLARARAVVVETRSAASTEATAIMEATEAMGATEPTKATEATKATAATGARAVRAAGNAAQSPRLAGQPPAPAADNSSAPEVEKTRPLEPGDRVWIHAMKRSAIVKSGLDDRGNLVVLVQKQPLTINHKRVAPYLTRAQLYPDGDAYDLDIVLESKETRKNRKIMSKRHVAGLSIEHDRAPDSGDDRR